MATLLVTNDFPPTIGGIQSYLRDFVGYLSQDNPDNIVVFASTQDAAAAKEFDANVDYTVIRWGRSIMLPTPATARRMQQIIREYNIDTVWFGAAAPLAVMGGSAKRAGATRVVATTHGHEVGWSMLPVARQILWEIGKHADVVTYISDYTLRRFKNAFGRELTYAHVPSGVDVDFFRPAATAERAETRQRFGIHGGPVIVCASRLVPRKGQDQLIRAMRDVLPDFPHAQLVIVGQGRYGEALKVLAEGLGDRVVFTGRVSQENLRDLIACADIVAMPARTRGGGLDVEGLGIVYLEAQACGVPVIAGQSGGAPETVTAETGIVVNGNSVSEILAALRALAGDEARRQAMGEAGREYVCTNWTWPVMGERLRAVLKLPPVTGAHAGEV